MFPINSDNNNFLPNSIINSSRGDRKLGKLVHGTIPPKIHFSSLSPFSQQ